MTKRAAIATIPTIPVDEQTPAVRALLALCRVQQEQLVAQQEQLAAQQERLVAQQERLVAQQEQIQLLKDEIARLKGQKGKPKLRPSKLEGKKKRRRGKRPGSAKRKKTSELQVHETIPVAPDNIPEGSRFKGYEDFMVQDILLQPHNTKYRLERWVTPTGETLMGKLPDDGRDGHFGVTLRSFVLYQYHHAQVTQPLLWQQLREMGVDISKGQLDRLITEGKDGFHEEKDAILDAGLGVARHVNVDDTGARHKGKNGVCTHIGNELFAWFASTGSKSRINFLKLLRGGHTDYVISSEALEYMRQQKLPRASLAALEACQGMSYFDEDVWQGALKLLGITNDRHIRIATEGALLGSALEHGLPPDLVIVSDGARQFVVQLHALCWVHAERLLAKLIGVSDAQRQALETKRSEIWQLYAELKRFKNAPSKRKRATLSKRFDEIFTEKTCFCTLNATLRRLHGRKDELLLVLERPDLPLHNNASESDIREYVKRRKISGSTRSDIGRRCRDTFTSLKKTCRKLGISFWEYVNDRLSGSHTIPPLNDVICHRAQENTT